MEYLKQRQTPAEIAQEEKKAELLRLAYGKPTLALGLINRAFLTSEENAAYLRPWQKHEVIMAAVGAYIRKRHFSTALRELARHAGSVNQDAKRNVVAKVKSCVEGFNDASLSNTMQLAIKDLGRFLSRSEQSEFCIRIQTRARIMATAQQRKLPVRRSNSRSSRRP